MTVGGKKECMRSLTLEKKREREREREKKERREGIKRAGLDWSCEEGRLPSQHGQDSESQ